MRYSLQYRKYFPQNEIYPLFLLNRFFKIYFSIVFKKDSYAINMSMEIIYCVPRRYTFGLDCYGEIAREDI